MNFDFKKVTENLSKKKRTEDKIARGEVVFNEDNVVRLKEFKKKQPGVIEVSTASMIVNIVVSLLSIVILFAILYGVWWVLTEVGFIDDLNNSAEFGSFKDSFSNPFSSGEEAAVVDENAGDATAVETDANLDPDTPGSSEAQ